MANDKLEKILQDQGIEQNSQEAKKDANMGVANVKNTPEKASIEALEKMLAEEQQQIAQAAQSITQIKQSIAQGNILYETLHLKRKCAEAKERKVKAISSKALTLLCKSNIEIAQANKVNKQLPTSDNAVAQIQSAIKQANAENAQLNALVVKLCFDIDETIAEIKMECEKQARKACEASNKAAFNKAQSSKGCTI